MVLSRMSTLSGVALPQPFRQQLDANLEVLTWMTNPLKRVKTWPFL